MTCMILHMESSVTTPPLDLHELYKNREVKRIATFADVASRLDPSSLKAAYAHARDSAPHRHDRNRTYFVDHCGSTNRSGISNRREEHLALALWRGAQAGDPIVLPNGATLEILDYQTPLKAQQKNEGVGKVDLFGLIDGCRSAVIELKIKPNSNGYGDTPLHAYLEALAYCAIVEANTSDIASEARTIFRSSIGNQPPGLIVMAPQEYWAGYLQHRSAGKWWPILSALAADVDKLLNLETYFLGLRDAAFCMGTQDQEPRLVKSFSVFDVNELIGD